VLLENIGLEIRATAPGLLAVLLGVLGWRFGLGEGRGGRLGAERRSAFHGTGLERLRGDVGAVDWGDLAV
jgi:hypothetical protein